MKISNISLKLPALLLLLPLLFSGCKKVETGLSAITWEINFDLVTTTWDIQFLDAATGLAIGATTEDQVEVMVTGPDAANIIDLAGIRQPRYFSTNGFMAMALHPDRPAPGEQAPVSFMIHASHPDYVPVSMPVISYHEGINPLKIYMLRRTASPENVALLRQTTSGSNTNGEITDPLSLLTADGNFRLDFEPGTTVNKPSGEKLTGAMTITLAGWSGATVNGLKMLPGGQVTLNSSGKAGLIYLAAGLYTDIIDQNGTYAASHSKIMHGTATVNPAVYNPATRTRVVPGESVPVWYMDPETGFWASRGTSTIMTAGDKLEIRIGIAAPGLYMAGWIQENLCTTPLLLHPGTLPEYSEIPYGFTLNVFEVFENEFRFIRSLGISGQANTDCELRMLPANAELLIRFESYAGESSTYYRNPDPLLLTNSCGSATPVSLELLPKTNSTFRKIEVVFIDVAHNNTRYNPKVFPGYYRKPGDSVWQSAFVFGGQSYMVNPQEGATYEMGINFKGKLHKKDVTIGTEDVILVEIDID